MSDNKISRKEQRAKERKEFREYVSIADKRVLDIKKSGLELIAKDEVFVLVNNTRNYWISNHGRLVNNLRKDFFIHKIRKVVVFILHYLDMTKMDYY